MTEEWRLVVGYPDDKYKVSNMGCVMSFASRHGIRANGKILKQRLNHKGYPVVQLSKNLESRAVLVHSLVAAAFLGERPAGFQVDHINGNKTDNRLENLEYVTPSENLKRSYALGTRSVQGAKHPRASLTNEVVIAIKGLLQPPTDLTHKQIAKQFGISKTKVDDISSGKCWGHLKLEHTGVRVWDGSGVAVSGG